MVFKIISNFSYMNKMNFINKLIKISLNKKNIDIMFKKLIYFNISISLNVI